MCTFSHELTTKPTTRRRGAPDPPRFRGGLGGTRSSILHGPGFVAGSVLPSHFCALAQIPLQMPRGYPGRIFHPRNVSMYGSNLARGIGYLASHAPWYAGKRAIDAGYHWFTGRHPYVGRPRAGFSILNAIPRRYSGRRRRPRRPWDSRARRWRHLR